MKRLWTVATAAIISVGTLSSSENNGTLLVQETSVSTGEVLRKLQEDYWLFLLADKPEMATFVGCAGDHGQWTDLSPEAFARRRLIRASFIRQLEAVDRPLLTKQERLQCDILKWLLDVDEGADAFPHECLCLNHLEGIHLQIAEFLKITPGEGRERYEAILSRMEGVAVLVAQQIALMRKGMELGIVAPKIVMQMVPQQISSQTAMPPEESEFFSSFASEVDEEIKARAVQAISRSIYPAYAALQQFLVDEYIPACRESVGFSDLPGGEEGYRYLAKMHTTTTLAPEEIHSIGLAEVARIADEMSNVLKEVGFEGGVHDYAAYLNSQSASFFASREELLEGYRSLLKKIEEKLPILFTAMPSLPCEVVAIPEYAEETSIAAYYFPSSVASGRPGRFFVNTHNLKDQPIWMMESLALHEALPGHHFQITVAQTADIPQVQRFCWTTAFVEGWGLYSESLGKELGLYQDPRTYFGRLVHEMLRALRLVVDTGLHTYGWTRQQAIDYYKKYLPIEEGEITNEIDRYIVMPGQALAYKIGEIKLQQLRRRLADVEGEAFDIRYFHDELLQLGGCLPLEVLEGYFSGK